MPVVGSTVSVDLHVTEDTDLGSLQTVVQQGDRVDPSLAQQIRQSVETCATDALDDSDVGDHALSVTVSLVTGRVPGAPRQRLSVDLDVEGEKVVVAAVDDAMAAPERAQLADAVEAVVRDHLAENDLAEGAEVIVSVPPIQFR
jgi:hypothetical protein